MRQYALKRNGKMLTGGVFATRSGCWNRAATDLWAAPPKIVEPFHVKQLKNAGYDVVRVEIKEV